MIGNPVTHLRVNCHQSRGDFYLTFTNYFINLHKQTDNIKHMIKATAKTDKGTQDVEIDSDTSFAGALRTAPELLKHDHVNFIVISKHEG